MTTTTTVPGAHLVALVYDIGPDGRARFVQRGAHLIAGAGTNELSFTLYPQDWEFRAGRRIGVLLSPGDDGWWTPGVTGQDVVIEGATATFPLIAADRVEHIEGGLSDASNTTWRRGWSAPARLADAEVDADLPPSQTPANR